MSIRSKGIVLGNVEIDADEAALKGAKIRITMMVDYDLLKAYKSLAKEHGAKYQTLMNKTLRDGLEKKQREATLAKRVSRLEQRVFRGEASRR